MQISQILFFNFNRFDLDVPLNLNQVSVAEGNAVIEIEMMIIVNFDLMKQTSSNNYLLTQTPNMQLIIR